VSAPQQPAGTVPHGRQQLIMTIHRGGGRMTLESTALIDKSYQGYRINRFQIALARP
jgi:hypothetical protein